MDDLIKNLLKSNPEERLTWKQYFNHSFFIPKDNCRKFYDIIKKIGSNIFADVHEAKHKESNELRAIKIYQRKKIKEVLIKEKPNITENDINLLFDKFKNEVRNMQIIEGKNKENNNAVKIYEFFENEEEFSVIMELCDDNLLNIFTNKSHKFNSSEIYNLLN